VKKMVYAWLLSWLYEEEEMEIVQTDHRQKSLKRTCMRQIEQSRLILKHYKHEDDDLPPLIVMRREKTITTKNKVYKRKLKKNMMKSKLIDELEKINHL
jgi:hypothetical protein